MDYKNYTIREAIGEVKRCLKYRVPSHQKGCPINSDVPDLIYQLSKGNLGEAREIFAGKTNLSAMCGRIYPYEKQYVGHCVLSAKHAPIQVGKLEKFIADFDAEVGLIKENLVHKTRGRVAVIGSGPAGLIITGDLARQGFNVVIYGKENEPGEVLVYGIPEFRLPKEAVRKGIKKIEALGVAFLTNVMISPDLVVDDMFSRNYDAISIGTGTALTRNIDLPGRDKIGILQAIYFLRMVALYNSEDMNRDEVPLEQGDKVVIIGAGNVAMDAAHTALRAGTESVATICHKGEEGMSALKSEYHSALEEGVQFIWHAKLAQFNGDERVDGITLKQGSQFLDVDTDVIMFVADSEPASRIVSTATGIEVNPNDCAVTREKSYGMTMRKGVLAGEDVVHQPAAIVLVMKEAKKVAEGIASYVDAIRLLELQQHPVHGAEGLRELSSTSGLI